MQDEVETLRDIAKIVIGFLQVIISLLRVDLSWPIDFENIMDWLSFMEFSVELPSIVCLMDDIETLHRLLVYTLSPLVLLALMALPSVYAAIRRHKAVDLVFNRFMSWCAIKCVGMVWCQEVGHGVALKSQNSVLSNRLTCRVVE